MAIGTVADLMPLNHLENRVLIQRGLAILNQAERPGIRALLEVSGIQPGGVTATSIGFSLGPRINAAGRLDDAMIAYNLLTAPNLTEAQKWAAQLQELNTRRQDLTRVLQEVVRTQIEQEYDTSLPLIFAASDQFAAGIVGLVAGRIADEFFRPTVIMEQGEKESRGSCRSIPQFDITGALDRCADLLVRHGGHALAAGFTVTNENIPALRERLLQIAVDTLAGQTLAPTLDIDLELDIHDLTLDLAKEFQLLEPCGIGNPPPTLLARNTHVAECRTVGKDEKHLRLRLSRASQPPLDAIGFGFGEWLKDMPPRIDLAFQLEINEWQGRQTLQANLKDIRLPDEDSVTIG